MSAFVRIVMIVLLAASLGCASSRSSQKSPADAFFAHLAALCGQAYAGRLTEFNESDAKAFAGPAVMHVRECSANEIRIPFHAGDNRSRTWVLTRTVGGLRLKHDHRHEDGSHDKLTQYGGDSALAGTEIRQEFPADDFSKALFERQGMQVSMDNTWAVEIQHGKMFAYELRRPNRHFRVEFDLSSPVPVPPAPWGSKD